MYVTSHGRRSRILELHITFDHTILDSCMYFLNVLPPRLAYLKNRINFLLKMNKTENDVVIRLFDLFGKLELKTICI